MVNDVGLNDTRSTIFRVFHFGEVVFGFGLQFLQDAISTLPLQESGERVFGIDAMEANVLDYFTGCFAVGGALGQWNFGEARLLLITLNVDIFVLVSFAGRGFACYK